MGFHTAHALMSAGFDVVGVDNLNDYYSVSLKKDRLKILLSNERFTFLRCDLADASAMQSLFSSHTFDVVINLAAQAGVRYSLENPQAYISSNVTGFTNILEGCRVNKISHLIYASSSSVYGLNTKMPFSETDRTDRPASLYAATKKSNELLAHTYSHLYGLRTTGLRFFTVYGPWGRPDMAYFGFTKDIIDGKPIRVFNGGNMERDFTYIDDVVQGITRIAMSSPSSFDESTFSSGVPYRLYNIGNNQPVRLLDFIKTIESELGIEAIKEFLPMQMGDVERTFANIDTLVEKIGYSPSTPIEVGIKQFIKWYLDYHSISLGGD